MVGRLRIFVGPSAVGKNSLEEDVRSFRCQTRDPRPGELLDMNGVLHSLQEALQIREERGVFASKSGHFMSMDIFLQHKSLMVGVHRYPDPNVGHWYGFPQRMMANYLLRGGTLAEYVVSYPAFRSLANAFKRFPIERTLVLGHPRELRKRLAMRQNEQMDEREKQNIENLQLYLENLHEFDNIIFSDPLKIEDKDLLKLTFERLFEDVSKGRQIAFDYDDANGSVRHMLQAFKDGKISRKHLLKLAANLSTGVDVNDYYLSYPDRGETFSDLTLWIGTKHTQLPNYFKKLIHLSDLLTGVSQTEEVQRLLELPSRCYRAIAFPQISFGTAIKHPLAKDIIGEFLEGFASEAESYEKMCRGEWTSVLNVDIPGVGRLSRLREESILLDLLTNKRALLERYEEIDSRIIRGTDAGLGRRFYNVFRLPHADLVDIVTLRAVLREESQLSEELSEGAYFLGNDFYPRRKTASDFSSRFRRNLISRTHSLRQYAYLGVLDITSNLSINADSYLSFFSIRLPSNALLFVDSLKQLSSMSRRIFEQSVVYGEFPRLLEDYPAAICADFAKNLVRIASAYHNRPATYTNVIRYPVVKDPAGFLAAYWRPHTPYIKHSAREFVSSSGDYLNIIYNFYREQLLPRRAELAPVLGDERSFDNATKELYNQLRRTSLDIRRLKMRAHL